VARLNRARLAPVLLGLLTLAVTLWLWRWATLNHSWGNDEELYRHFARGISRDFGLFFHMDPSYGRGIQRLHLLLLALPMMVFKNPTAFNIGHLLFVAAYASSAIPAWLIARGCGVNRYAALIPAALVVLTPWMVVSTSFLAEPVGYGAFAWAVWGIWRAATRPSIGADILAVVLLGIALLARTGFLLLLPVLPAVAVLQAWRYATGDGPLKDRLRRLPMAALRRQPLSVGLGLLGALLLLLAWVGVLPGGPSRFTGTYATSLPPLWLMASKWRSFLSRIDAGTGFILFACAVPWFVARIVKPREPALHAFAWTALLASATVLLSLVGGPADERYVMFVAFPVVLGGCLALLRRELNAVMALLGGAAALILFFTPGWKINDVSDFGYFGFPVDSFMWRVVLTKLGNAVSSVSPRTTAGLLIAAALVVLIALAGNTRWRRWLPLAIVPAALFQLAAAGYAINKHVNTVGAHHGPDATARAWVDQHVPRDADVGLYAVSAGLTADYGTIFREVDYWNTTLHSVVKIASPFTLFPTVDVPYEFGTQAIQADLDVARGKVNWKGPPPFPDYLVVPQPPLSVILDWKDVAQASYIPAKLVKVRYPLQARSLLSGVTPTGYMNPPTPAQIRVYAAARPQPRCVALDLLAPRADAPKPGMSLPYRLTDSGTHREIAAGRIATGKLKRLCAPVPDFGRGASWAFDITTKGTFVANGGGKFALQVANYDPSGTPCPG
jgi:hypothetical protein